MKFKKTAILISSLILCLFLTSCMSIFEGVLFQDRPEIITVKNYNEFCSAFSSALKNKSAEVRFKIIKYNKVTYNIPSIINKVEAKNPQLKYIISGYSIASSGGNTKYLNIKLNYKDAQASVKKFNEFYAAIKKAYLKHEKEASVKINNYSSKVYNLSSVITRARKDKINIIINEGNIESLSGSNIVIMYISLAYPGDAAKVNTIVSYDAADYNDVYNAIKDGLLKASENIGLDIKDDKLKDSSVLKSIIEKVLDDNPDLNYVDSYGIHEETETLGRIVLNKKYTAYIKYRFPKDQVLSMQKAVNSMAFEIVKSVIKPSMSQYEKELVLHDYIVRNSKYDYTNYKKGTIPNVSFTAYGVLINGVGVCEGYSAAFYKLLTTAGIECRLIAGVSGEPHAWNIVKIDGKYYHVDITFDDPVINGGEIERVSHRYFNLSDNVMSKDHSWDRSKYPACTSTKYDYNSK